MLGCAFAARAQVSGPKVDRVDIKYVGPASVSEQYVRANIQLKAGDTYSPDLTQNDIHTLYATGQFYNIRVTVDQANDGGVIVTYLVQVRPRVAEIKIEGNKKLSDSKIRKKITVKVGEPLDEEKLFSDSQAIKQLYEKAGYPETQVKYVLDIDENAGRGDVTFEIKESPKVKIEKIQFIGAAAFTQRELRRQIKTKEKWMFSWLTGSDLYKDDQFQDDRDRLVEFYRSHGYLDFEIKDVKLDHPTPNQMVIRFYVYEGKQYKVGSVKFSGNKIFNDAAIQNGLRFVHDYERSKDKLGPHGLPMDAGDVFTPDGLEKDRKIVGDFYGSKGYLGPTDGPLVRIVPVPNVDTGTMNLEFQIDEGQKDYIERIDIRGNVKTKDKVIRRELAVSPGEVFDMLRVQISQKRLEGLQYFDKVEMDPEPTEPPIAGHKNLVVNVEEENTGNVTLGAGFSSVDSLVGFVDVTQGNFDLFHPPTFTGGGQKARLHIELGTKLQDYELSFIEPWLFNRKLSFGVDLYRREWDYESPNNIFNEIRTGARFSLSRALWSDFLIGSVSYTIEDVGIDLNSGFHNDQSVVVPSPVPFGPPSTTLNPRNVPQAILNQVGDHLFHRFDASLAYDTRNSTELPNGGQRTELDADFTTGDDTYYKLELKTDWFFRGLFKGHVIEIGGDAGVADSLSSGDVPFYDRYYLGGLYNLRGFKYRNIGPREPVDPFNPGVFEDPIGGDSFWYGSVEYSLPIIENENVGLRFALFYDVGDVGAGSYSFSGNFDDNWGLGLRLNIPRLGPLRLDYGVPIHHDQYNGGSGQFNFSVGYSRPF